MTLVFSLATCPRQGAKEQKSQACTLCEPLSQPSGPGWVLGRPRSDYLCTGGLRTMALCPQGANRASVSRKQVECFCSTEWGTGREIAAPGA